MFGFPLGTVHHTRLGGKFVRSIWFFPTLLTVVLLLLTVLQISGSSVGIYHAQLYGQQPDAHLLFNNPQPIRSDEFAINTQLAIAQDAAGYPRVNPNIGQGVDVSLIVDAPYKDWSAFFKPHNLAFLVLPFDYAFAFKWWLMGYLLILSCYFFVLALMPKRHLLAAGLSLALFFSPFVQWWYQYGTLGPLYYALFAATVFIYLVRSGRLLTTVAWGALLAYLLACFVLVLYPPFQIACALAVAAFAIGYLIEQRPVLGRRRLLRQLGITAGALAVTAGLVAAFFATRLDIIHTIQNTAYPGQRLQQSGGFDLAHLLSGHTSFELQSSESAARYTLPAKGLTNQSEDSNFLLVFPYLVMPSFFLLYRLYRDKRSTDWPLLLVNLAFLGALAWLFVPHIDLVGKLLLLDQVPHTRLLIGIGLLNFIGVALLIRRLQHEQPSAPHRAVILGYTAVVLLVQALLSLHVVRAFPGYMHMRGFVLSLIPVPLVTYLVLRKRFTSAATALLIFSAAMTAFIHPLYRSAAATLTQTPLSRSIRAIHAADPGAAWAVEVGSVLNFAAMNGARSLSGVYPYPQLDLWATADEQGQQKAVYNRYAHVNFVFDRDPGHTATTLVLTSADHFEVHTDPCGTFLRQQHVKYLLTRTELGEPCLALRETVRYPAITFFIYEVR